MNKFKKVTRSSQLPWNYALQIDREHPETSITFETKPVGDRPFSQDAAPIVAQVKGRKLPGWTLEKNAAAPPPRSPVAQRRAARRPDADPLWLHRPARDGVPDAQAVIAGAADAMALSGDGMPPSG